MNSRNRRESLDNETRILVRGIATDKIHYDNLRSAVRVERCGEKLLSGTVVRQRILDCATHEPGDWP